MKIDLGCGNKKEKGFLGVDKINLDDVDIICDLDREKIPLDNSSVDEIVTRHFLEHVVDLVSVMEEMWRVCKHGAKITIAVPYFRSVGAFRDPTHRQFFTFNTFEHFTNTKKYPSFYSKIKFKILKRKLYFYPSNSNIYGKIRFLHMLPIQVVANCCPYFYEHSWLKFFSARDLYIELEVVKNNDK